MGINPRPPVPNFTSGYFLDYPLFSGEHDLTLDDKSRLMIPAPLRKKINPELHGEGFYLVLSPERRLWVYPDRFYEWLVTRGQEADAIPQRDLLAHDRLAFGLAVQIELDKAGRIVVPEKSRVRAKLGKEVTVIGARDHLEIWDRQAWLNESEGLLENGQAIAERARMARRGETGLQTQTVTGLGGHF